MRQIAVQSTSTSVKFTEKLGTTASSSGRQPDQRGRGHLHDGATGVANRSTAVSSATDNFTLEAWFRADALPSAGIDPTPIPAPDIPVGVFLEAPFDWPPGS